MNEPTTITIPATKRKGYGRGAGIAVNIVGATVGGYGATLLQAKGDALANLLELATIAQSAPAVTVYHDGDDQLITVYYPHGTGTQSLNIRVTADSSIRVTATASHSGTPEERANVPQPNVNRIY